MKKLNYILFCLPLFFLAASCNDDDDLQPLPGESPLETLNRLVPITQTGAGTFGCLVNGEVWIPEVDGSSDVAADAIFSSSELLEISCTKEPLTDNRYNILTIGSRIEVGLKTPMTIGRFFDDNQSGNCVVIEINISELHYIRIDFLDQDSQIISGHFECTMQEPDCPNTKIEITHGRFDLNYRF